MSQRHSIRVVRMGTALEVDSVDGTRLYRGVELARQIGAIGLGDITGAEFIDGETVGVKLVSGATEPFSLRAKERVADLVVRGAALMTCDGDRSNPLEVIEDGAVIVGSGKILWRGLTTELDSSGFDITNAEEHDVRGALVSPGLIDCHTHLAFGGSRAEEFGMRAAGSTYQEIAAAGGGIASTRRHTLDAPVAIHLELASQRLDQAALLGTTTVEAKSGYALTVAGELEILEIYAVLDSIHALDVVPTLLGAHVVPPEMRESRETYVEQVASEMIPRAAADRLCKSVDVYCDDGAFSLAETRHILESAVSAGLDIRAHVGQFADLGGPQLLAELGALSADHLEEISADGIASLAAGGVVAVMLPTACVQLRQTPPPVAALREAGVTMAVASDLNPGSSFCEGLAVPMWLATTHYGMTVEETWLGVTRHAARALGRHDIGTITVGARADLAIWDCQHPAEVPYRIGRNQVASVIKDGRLL